jgi:hypothetical protein
VCGLFAFLEGGGMDRTTGDWHPLTGLPSSLPDAVLDPLAVLAQRQDLIYRAVLAGVRFACTSRIELEALIVAMKADLTAALDRLQAAVTSRVGEAQSSVSALADAVEAGGK